MAQGLSRPKKPSLHAAVPTELISPPQAAIVSTSSYWDHANFWQPAEELQLKFRLCEENLLPLLWTHHPLVSVLAFYCLYWRKMNSHSQCICFHTTPDAAELSPAPHCHLLKHRADRYHCFGKPKATKAVKCLHMKKHIAQMGLSDGHRKGQKESMVGREGGWFNF